MRVVLTGCIPSVLYTVERVVGTRRFNPYRPDKAKVESSILSCPTKKEEKVTRLTRYNNAYKVETLMAELPAEYRRRLDERLAAPLCAVQVIGTIAYVIGVDYSDMCDYVAYLRNRPKT